MNIDWDKDILKKNKNKRVEKKDIKIEPLSEIAGEHGYGDIDKK